jgi:hypothetical protein
MRLRTIFLIGGAIGAGVALALAKSSLLVPNVARLDPDTKQSRAPVFKQKTELKGTGTDGAAISQIAPKKVAFTFL